MFAAGLFFVAVYLALFDPQMPEFNIANTDETKHGIRNVFTSGIALLIAAALGTNAYTNNERDGLGSVTYYHPISKKQLFLSKQITAIPALVLVSISTFITLADYVEAFPVVAALFCAYQFSMFTSLASANNSIIVILGALSLEALAMLCIGLWMTPMDNALFFDGFRPVHDPTVVASLPLVLLTIGAFMISFKISSDRRFLAGTMRFRGRYAGTLILIACAVTCLLTTLVSMTVEL